MNQFPFYIAVFILLSLSCSQNDSVIIKGKIIDRPLDTLILFRSQLNPRLYGTKIPIRQDSTFYYEFTPDNIEQYQVAFASEVKKSMYLNIPFYSDGPMISFELHKSEEHEKNKIIGSNLTTYQKEHVAYMNREYAPQLDPIYQKLFENDVGLKEKVALKQKVDSLHIIKFEKSMELHMKNPNITGFNEFVIQLEDLYEHSIPLEILETYYKYWIEKYPSHPLTERAINKYTALTELHNEKTFVDFETIDDSNNSVSFSNHINKNKFTLLDLWAPWCGPCIRKSQEVKSSYQDLSKNGLSVFSVVGGITNKDEYDQVVNRLDYPWSSFLEIANQNKIWEKYGISNAGGSQFLFNNKGKLIATNPSIDELKGILKTP